MVLAGIARIGQKTIEGIKSHLVSLKVILKFVKTYLVIQTNLNDL